AIVQRCNELALLKQGFVVLLDSLEILSKMPESLTLADRRLVVDVSDSIHQRIIEGNDLEHNAIFFSPADHVPGLGIDLLLPPMFVRRNGENSIVRRLPVIAKSRSGIVKLLDECKNVSGYSRVEALNEPLRLADTYVGLTAKPGDLKQPAGYGDQVILDRSDDRGVPLDGLHCAHWDCSSLADALSGLRRHAYLTPLVFEIFAVSHFGFKRNWVRRDRK